MYLYLYKYREYKMDPVRITLLTGLYKGADKSLAISHCCRGNLVGRSTFCILTEWFSKVGATG